MATTFAFDEDAALTANEVVENGICTNRSASGPVTLTLPASPTPGMTFEIHRVEPYALTVAGTSAGDDLCGAGQFLTLPAAGRAARLTYTSARRWTGFLG